MEIRTKRELKFVMQADYIMNRGKKSPSLADRLHGIGSPDYIMKYLRAMRKTSYYRPKHGLLARIAFLWNYSRYKRLGMKLGFSIGYNTLGYGAVMPHYGTIVVGESNRIGNFAVLHTSTCITDDGKVIGDGLYLSAGVKITRQLKLGNNIHIGANSLVNKSYEGDNMLIGGMPAEPIRPAGPWYTGSIYEERHKMVEDMDAFAKTAFAGGKSSSCKR